MWADPNDFPHDAFNLGFVVAEVLGQEGWHWRTFTWQGHRMLRDGVFAGSISRVGRVFIPKSGPASEAAFIEACHAAKPRRQRQAV